MASEATLYPRDRAKIRLPLEVLDRLDLLVDGVRNRIVEAACPKAARRKRGADAWRVTHEDLLLASCKVLRETVSRLETELNQYGKQAIRVRDAS